ncbi:aminoacyl-histidine dipeptidase [Butyrivibrio sp. INlla14]|uniref:aminoacyl-histidine dipeptidase n=1 Tax=Butyrivibrio sp. INlla14 TaxID=1520808 RepID=UPI00087718F6|nr:aminoacyl-histidine dipeptidase [Butyrivibrio sp. INlla14]SCY41786.1 dipeptidase D [Butyrivibrio sp. INlla14]
MALENLQPREVFTRFEELCNIPHGSGNLQQISDHIVSFARERGLEVTQDSELNVIIKAPGTAGYEDKEPVILQGHMDMVAVKNDDCDIDMKTEGLRVTTDGEYVWAEGTSLGGDDGIAVAYCLALLDSKDIPHPPLEVVITTNEETGMYGAAAIDLSGLKGKKMINIDNEEEGVFITSCAGGARVYSKVTMAKESVAGALCKVSISGLLGGHSGEMIKYGRGNANIIAGRLLKNLSKAIIVNLVSIGGGVADNAIPGTASLEFVVANDKVDEAGNIVNNTLAELKGELEGKDDNINISFDKISENEAVDAFSAASTESLAKMISIMPDGVQAMSAMVEGLVETSLNLGIIKTEGNLVTLEQSVRSSVESSKNVLIGKLLTIGELFGAEVTVSGQYPGWKYRQHSELRDHMVSVYEKMYGKKPLLQAIHAGLECGILSEKIDDLDCISIGPDMQDIHSASEKLSVKSASNVWEYLKAVLA